jgi:hypothetical protein
MSCFNIQILPDGNLLIKTSLDQKNTEGEYDIGCLQIENHNDYDKNDNPSIEMQVFYGKEIYDMFLPIILNAYYDTKVYSVLMQRHRDEQIGKLFD